MDVDFIMELPVLSHHCAYVAVGCDVGSCQSSLHLSQQLIILTQLSMSDLTTVEETPPSDDTVQPSDEPTESVESLKEKLAAEQKKAEEALEEAKRWKNRVKDENPPKERKKDPDEEYADWRIDNKDRIALVKEQYEAELTELQELGAKPTLAIREKALRLAEKTVGVKTVETTEPLPSGTVHRSGQREPTMTEHDIAMGIKPETKKKYAQLESQW